METRSEFDRLYIVDGEGTIKRLGEMTGNDLEFVANAYENGLDPFLGWASEVEDQGGMTRP